METSRSPDELREILATLEALDHERTWRKLSSWKPYPKQRAFFDLGKSKRERLMMAGNQVGKSDAGAYEMACHLTGRYPKWWRGKRFAHPVVAWAAGISTADVRNIQQKKLCGPPGVESELGTGFIPREDILDVAPSHGLKYAYESIQVQHHTNGVADGVSRLIFKSYEQGRKAFQGDTISCGWCDEEPEDGDIYHEFLTRLTGDGILFTTFTPLYGPTDLVNSFIGEDSPDRGLVGMELDEAEHFSAEEKAKRLAGYRAHERDARAKGIPKLGSGVIFVTPEDNIIEPPIVHVPATWRKLWGIDFGIGHPFAAVLILWEEPDGADVIHVHHAYRIRDALSLVQATHMLRVAADVPVAWPRDGTERDRNTGKPLSDAYKAHGLKMLHQHAQWSDGSVSTEAGIDDWDEREKTGRLKVGAHLSEWFEERRFYHRKEGKIVKVRDDLMSATRIALMAKRFARSGQIGNARSNARKSFPCRGTAGHPDGEFNPFTGA